MNEKQPELSAFTLSLHFARVVDDAKCIVVTHVCVSVCLSAAVRPHYCADPDVTWGHGRGCPLVVHYLADLQSGHGLHCYGNITWTIVTHPAIWRHSANGRLGGVCVRCWPLTGGWRGGRSQNCAPYMGSGRGWLAGDWPSTGAFSTLLRRPGLRASSDGILATKSEWKMLASTCFYVLYAWLIQYLAVLKMETFVL